MFPGNPSANNLTIFNSCSGLRMRSSDGIRYCAKNLGTISFHFRCYMVKERLEHTSFSNAFLGHLRVCISMTLPTHCSWFAGRAVLGVRQSYDICIQFFADSAILSNLMEAVLPNPKKGFEVSSTVLDYAKEHDL